MPYPDQLTPWQVGLHFKPLYNDFFFVNRLAFYRNPDRAGLVTRWCSNAEVLTDQAINKLLIKPSPDVYYE